MSVKYFDKTQNKWVIFPGSIGAPGRSAYELAVQQGYKGTLDEWLLSLKGKDAYTIAVEGGYKGTEEEFNNALTTAPIAVDNITNIVNTEISNQIKSSIVDNLTSSETEKSLSAKQGKVLKDLIDSLANLQITIVNSLPSVGESNIIYLVKKSGTGTDVHDEYIYVEGAWEKIGTTDIDLSDYYTKSQVDTITNGLDNKISNNTLRINNITTNGSITPEVLKIQKNGVDLLDPWNGSKEGVANIVVPTSLSELNPTEQDIIDALGYRPADAAQAGMGDIVAKDNILGGIKTGYTESGGAEMAIYTLEDGTAYTLLRDTAVKTALGFTPANVNDIPIALPNPYALNITAGGSSTNYTGSATANLNLDKVFSKKLATVTTPGQPGIFVGTAASYEVSSLYVSENNPDAIIVIPASSSISFNNTIYTEMKDLGSLTGGTYKCYCITYINSSIVLVNGAVYGYDATN